MPEDQHKPRPGDHLLNKYFPDADEETRERAREAFRQYALLMVRWGTKIEEDLLREEREKKWAEEHPDLANESSNTTNP